LRDRVAAWRELLDECGRKPTRKRVHALRVVTLRIQAELEYQVADLPHASHQVQATLRFGKLAEKLRGVLAPVRELDVWIGKLQRLRASLIQGTGYVPRSTHECIRQIGKLEDRLKKRRRSAAQKLVAQITKHRWDRVLAGDEIEELASDHVQGSDSHMSDTILNQFAAIAKVFAEFNEENLHDFRKRIKKVRYLAEIHQDSDNACAQIAVLVKKAQTAIGEWHDWQVLARSMQHTRRRRDVELEELLESLASERFEQAIGVCHATRARLLEMQARSVALSSGSKRRPPVSGSQLAVASLEKSA